MKCKILFVLLIVACVRGVAQTDSLAHYLEMAARENPLVKSEFLTYKASLEKIPQAGAIPDPQLEIGLFVKPMDILDGKQIADFKLMQMFPWFGTRRAARSEASEMARMAYEKFRGVRDNLFLEVKSSWYTLLNQRQQLATIRENKRLLEVLKELATNRFAAPPVSATGKNSTAPMAPVVSSAPAQPAAGGMSGMASAGSAGNTSSQVQITRGMGPMASNASMGEGMRDNAQGGLSDILRIDMELNELEEEEQAVMSRIISAEAKFNSLLNRPAGGMITLPDSIARRVFFMEDDIVLETIRQQNPMLRMASAEADAYQAKLRMDKKMGLPMIGIGVQYSLIGERMAMGIPTTDMNGKDMIMPMVSLTLPLYRNKYKAQQNESRLKIQATEEKYRGTLNSLAVEYITIKEQLADADRKIGLYEKQRQLTLVAYQLAVSEFASGVNTIANVLDIERRLLDYKFKHSEAIATYNTVVAMIENLLSEPQTE